MGSTLWKRVVLPAIPFLLIGFFVCAAPAYAQALPVPSGKTVTGTQQCQDKLGNIIAPTNQLGAQNGGFCRVNFADGTFEVVNWDAATNAQTTQIKDQIGNILSKTTISGADVSANNAAAAAQTATNAGQTAQQALNSTVKTTLNDAGIPSTGPGVSVPADQITAMTSAVNALQSSGSITAAQAATLQTEIAQASAGKLDAAHIKVLNDLVAAQSANAATQSAATAAGGSAASSANNASAADAAETLKEKQDCSLTSGDFGVCVGDILGNVVKQIAVIFLFLAAVILGVCGLIFNWTIYVTIFQFGNLVGNNAGMLAAWGVLRDIGNILLLFGFILMGVSTILDLPNSNFTAKRALPGLIIFAVLLNFSLFAAEAVIDTTNALGASFYNQASPVGKGICVTTTDLFTCITQFGIAGQIFQTSGVSAIFDPKTLTDGTGKTLPDGIPGAIEAIGLTLFLLVAAFVFIVAFILLITRAVVLAFIMTVSPIGFAGMAIPPLHGIAKQWWDQLLKQAFFAPVLILFLFITIKFMNGVAIALASASGTAGTQNLAKAFGTSGASNMSIVIVFILMIGFMLASVQIARSMGAIGAGAATKFAGGVTFGVYARATNLAVGGGAAGLARTQRFAARNGVSFPFAAAIQSGLMAAQKANLDIRQAAPNVVGAPVEHASYADTAHKYDEFKKGINQTQRNYENSLAKDNLKKEINDMHGDTTKKLTKESERFVMGINAKQLKDDHDLEHLLPHGLARFISADVMQEYAKDKDVSDTNKAGARDSRYGVLRVQIERSDGKQIRKWSVKDLEQFLASPGWEKMESAQRKEFISLLSDDQYDGVNKSTNVIPSVKTDVEDLRNARFDETSVAPDAEHTKPEDRVLRIDRTLKGMNSSEKRGKLEDEVLKEPAVYERLNPADFDAIRRAEKISDATQKEMGIYLKRKIGTDPRFQGYFKTMAAAKRADNQAFYQTDFGLDK